MNQKTWILILAQELNKRFHMKDRGGGEEQQQEALLAYKLVFIQTFDCLNMNQDFKIRVTAELRLYRKWKRGRDSSKWGKKR